MTRKIKCQKLIDFLKVGEGLAFFGNGEFTNVSGRGFASITREGGELFIIRLSDTVYREGVWAVEGASSTTGKTKEEAIEFMNNFADLRTVEKTVADNCGYGYLTEEDRPGVK